MGDKKTNTGYIKVTDDSVTVGARSGYHTVPQMVSQPTQDDPERMVPWSMPQFSGDGRDWEFVDVSEVRQNAPRLLEYNADPETSELSEDERVAAEEAKTGVKAKAEK